MTVRPATREEIAYFADAHRRVYRQEYRWGPAFCDYAAHIAETFVRSERDEFFAAAADGQPAGCIMLCQTEEPGVGQLRLFLVEKDRRGTGIGTALVDALLEKARKSGYERLILWTASPLVDAIHLYEKYGFRKTEEQPNTSWSLDGETVMEEKYELAL